MKKTFTQFLAALALLAFFIPSLTAVGQTKITDYSNIVSGNTYYIGATTGGTDYYLYVYHDYNSTSTAGTAQTSMNDATTFVFEGSGTSWTIKFDNGKYLSLKDGKDNGKVQVVTDPATFTTSNQSGKIRLSKGNYSVQKNNSGTQFGSYANTQTDIWLMEVPSSLSLTTTSIDASGITNTDVYTSTAAGSLSATVTEETNHTVISGATVTWSSSNESIATIASDGTVTLVAEGITTITAYYAGVTGEYGESSDTYELTVTDSAPFVGGDITFDAGIDKGTTTTTGYDEMSKKVVTISSTSAAFATAEYRIYSGSVTTISTTEGTITNIAFTKNGNYSLGNLSAEIGTYNSSTGVWTGNAQSVDFDASAQVRLDKIVVTVDTSGTPDPEITASNVNIEYDAIGGDIIYSVDNVVTDAEITANTTSDWIKLPATFDSPISFTCSANTETTARTATVTLNYVKNNEILATKDVTVTQAAAPTIYTTVPALFAAATNVEQDIRVTFGNWIVSGVSTNGRNVYVTDNSSNGFIIYFTSDMSSTFSEGSILSGTAVACKLKTYNGAAELINLNANDLTITTGGTVTTANIAMADLSGINTGALVSYNNLTCSLDNNKYYLSDGTTTVQAYNTLYAFNEFEADKIYNVTGVYVQYNNIKEIAPRSVADIVEVTPASVSYQYSINGVLDPIVYNCAVGSTKTLETGSDLYSDFTFAGWTTDPNDVSQHLTEYTFQDANPVTFYAVYGHITPGTINSSAKGYEVYSQVTNVGSLTSMGEYLITSKITGNNSDYPYLFNGLSGQNQYVAGTYAGNSIISDLPAGAAIVNISTHSDANNVSGFSIRISGNTSNNLDRYIGGTSGTSTMNFSNNPILNIISFDENGNADIVSNTSHLRLDEPNGEFCYYTQPESKNTIQLYKKVTNYYTRVLNETATADIYLLGPSIIPSYGVLDMATYEIDRESGSFSVPYLIIEEGGQFIYKGNDIKCEVQKSITKPSGTWGQDDNTGWYAISSPVGRISKYSEIDYFEYILNNVKMFDYFAYGEDFGWYNKIDEDTYVREMKAGHGYLYARAENTMLFFRSETDRDDCDLTNLSYTSSRGNLAGLHFIGNPYTHNIYKGVGITGDMTTGYYALNEATGAWISTTDNTPIVPMQAVMVFVNKTDGTAAIHMTSDNSAPSTKSNNDYIQFTVGNNEYEDVAYAWFDKGEGLRKINHRNSEIPMVYIPQGDINYSIATMNDNTQSFNLNFKAMTTGQYTLSYKTQGEFNYMHIYDRLTGVDVDMLLEGEYSFIGSPSDNDARFIVSLGYMPNYNGDDNFVYQNGNDIIVNGEGELQVFDVTGRMVMKTMVEGVQTVNMLSNGVYVFRMIGENVKTQKIVVR